MICFHAMGGALMISILGGRGKYLFASREMDICDYIPEGFWGGITKERVK